MRKKHVIHNKFSIFWWLVSPPFLRLNLLRYATVRGYYYRKLIVISIVMCFPVDVSFLRSFCLLDSRHGPQGRWEDRELKSVEIPLFHLSLWSYPSSCE